jgi:predicted nucleic acid-binding protein
VRVVVDSSVLIDHLRADDRARRTLAERIADGDELWGVVVSRAEVLAGMRSAERAPTLRLLDHLRWLEVDVELADEAGALARRFRRSHPGLELADCLIAAGAVRLDAQLLTQNVRHFPILPGLEPAYR